MNHKDTVRRFIFLRNNRQLESTPLSKRIVESEERIKKKRGKVNRRGKSNCHGSAIFNSGKNNCLMEKGIYFAVVVHGRPGYVPHETMKKILEKSREINEEEALGGVISEWEDGLPIHSGIYVARKGRKRILLTQDGIGGKFDFYYADPKQEKLRYHDLSELSLV